MLAIVEVVVVVVVAPATIAMDSQVAMEMMMIIKLVEYLGPRARVLRRLKLASLRQ